MAVVVADSSPLVYLARLGRLELLRLLYSEVLIPDAVWREVAVEGGDFTAASAGWIRVESCAPAAEEPSLRGLDDGEREAITLAIRLRALLIIDEAAGRAAATKLGVTLTGTLGVLVQATRRGFVPRLQTELDRLRVATNFRCADELITDALKAVGEKKP